MTILRFALLLLGIAGVIFIAGYVCYFSSKAKVDFNESVIFMRELIDSSELSVTAYRNILDAFRDFDTMSYQDRKVYKKLFSDFLLKYKDFLPADANGIKIIAE
jgi:hypothetical protein